MACDKRDCSCKCRRCRTSRHGQFTQVPGTEMAVREPVPERHCWKHRLGCHLGCSSHDARQRARRPR